MTTTSTTSTPDLIATNARRVRMVDMTAQLKDLFDSTLHAARGAREAALEAMRMYWRWICALADRLARALGFKTSAPDQLSDAQLAGEAPTGLELAPGPGNAAASAPQVDAARETVFAEAKRAIEYLIQHPVDPALLAEEETAAEFVRFHASRIGSYHAVFQEHVATLEAELETRCQAIAAAAGTTPAVIKAQILANNQLGLYDKSGDLKSLIDELHEAKLAMRRVELVAASFIEAAGHPAALPGIKQHALAVFQEMLPGVPLDREPAPTGLVAQLSGETTARPAANDDKSSFDDGDKSPEGGDEERATLARDGIGTKNALEFGALSKLTASLGVSGTGVKNAGMNPVRGLLPPVSVTEEAKDEALASPFASGAMARLAERARRRDQERGSDWGDQQHGR